jgi:hypothetical protein
MELLADAASEAQSLQLLHRFGWPIGKRVQGVCGKSKLGDPHATALEREPAKPPDRSTLVAIRIAVPQHQADAQRVVKGYLWKLTGRSEDQVGVAGLEGPSETNVWSAGIAHPNVCSHPGQAGVPTRGRRPMLLLLASAVGLIVWSMVASDRVQERRRAVALARHYRDKEGLSLGEIARRLGRAEATVKAYFNGPSYANKRPYTSLGATRAVYGAPAQKADPGFSRTERERTLPWRGGASPTPDPVRRSSAHPGWWMARERSVCGGGLNTGVHATPN